MQKTCPACGSLYDEDANVCPVDGFDLIAYEGPDPLLGEVLDGRFRIDEVLGEGGMGQVYRARQLSVDRDVAVKVMRAEYSIDRQIRERFFREARVISGLNHPNIVQLIDFGHDAEHNRLYLAMEFLSGVSLRELLGRGDLRRDVSIAIIAQALSGLAEAHANGIVHRDLKPDNLMVVANADGGFQLKVLDFGIAHSATSDKKLTTTGAVMGTPHYMAPEQARGESADHRTDIHAIGTIFYEMLSGELAIDGQSAMQILVKLATETPTDLSSLIDQDPLNERLTNVVMRLLERDAKDRPQSVTEVNQQLSEIVREFAIPKVTCAPDREDPFGVWFGDEPSISAPESNFRGSNPLHIQKPLADPTTQVEAVGHETRGELAELEDTNQRTTAIFLAVASVFVAATALAVWFAMQSEDPGTDIQSADPPVEDAPMEITAPPVDDNNDVEISAKTVDPEPDEDTEEAGPPARVDEQKETIESKPEVQPRPRKKSEPTPVEVETRKPKSDADLELEKRLESLDKVPE